MRAPGLRFREDDSPEWTGEPAELEGASGQIANEAFYAAARGPKELWEVPGSGHMKGIEAQPAEYERRVVGFFDRTLLPHPTDTTTRSTP